jgi:predicted ATPase/DNA-binding winged helix-turn-helix (wHTH) protein
MPAQDRQLVYVAGQWEVDLARRELRARGVRVPVGGRAFEVMEVLIRSAGEIVTNDEMIARVWPGVTVEYNTLHVHISALRKILGSDRGMLRTVSGRGYRLLGAWEARRQSTSSENGPLVSTESRRPFQTNLPEATSQLIGRDAAEQHLRDLLSTHRVVTLTGPGGIGKTRLALELARTVFSNFQGDCWLVELASLSDPGLVPSAVARFLGLRLSEEAVPDAVAQFIGDKKLFLVLDNCEHVVEAAAQFVETIVRSCPRTSILATSREVLRIDGEYVYRVPPLDAPPEDQADPKRLLEHGAVQLFVSKATASRADLLPDQENLLAISAICRRLDGIPLAIEFAAARAATLGLRHVAARLDDRFEFLTSGRRTALPRHQTLRATLDWSYELLTHSEQHVLRRLAVFQGGFTLEAAAAVADGPANAASVIEDIVGKLATKSLVQLDGSGHADRWRMLETIRAYALEKLDEAGEVALTNGRHAEYFRDLFLPVSPLQRKVDGMDQFVRDLDNVRAALDWCFSPDGDLAIGVSLTAAYVPVWLNLSLVAECQERAGRAVACSAIESTLSAQLRMQLYLAFGMALVQSRGAEEQTGAVLAQALEIATTIDDVDAELRALWAYWTYLDHKGDHGAARSFAQRFSQAARRKGDKADILVGDRLIGYTAHYLGDQAEARRRLEGVVEGYVAPTDKRHVIWFQHDQHVVARIMLARVLCFQGFLDQARHHAQASLRQAQTANQTLTLRYVLAWGSCPVSLMIGDLEAAQESVAMLVDLAARRRLPFWQTVGRAFEGTLAIRRGEFASGSALLRSAIDDHVRPGWIVRFPEFIGAFAEGLVGLEQFPDALSTLAHALGRAERGEARWYVAELLRIKGEILLQGGENLVQAETCFREALDVARCQGALLWELRSAMSLTRLLRRQGRPEDARQILSPVYSRFSEGFDAADLCTARATLESLSDQLGAG